MKNVKYLVMAAVLLLLAACGQVAGPELEQNLTTLDDGQVTDNANATLTSINFGDVCKEGSANRTVRLYALTSNRTGNKTSYSGPSVWANGATLSVGAVTNATAVANGFSASVPQDQSTLALRNNWQTLADGQRSVSNANLNIAFSAGATTGQKTGQVTYALTGTDTTKNNPGPLTKSVTINVSANVISCNEAPVINIQQPLSFEGDTAGGWTFSSFALIGTASDTEDVTPAVTCTPVVGSVLGVGSNNISCTARDSGGLTATAAGTITVTDTTAPVISGLPGDLIKEATGPDGANVSWTAPTASDIVTGSRPVTCDRESGSTFALGTTTVTCSAADGNGNSNSQSFTVTVQDTTPPTLTDLGSTSSPNAAGWYNSAVTNTFKAADAVGFAEGFENPFTKSSGTTEGSAVKINSGSVSDAAGNEAQGIDSAAFMIDLIKPTSSVSGVTQSANYAVGSVPAAGCSSSDVLSGIATGATLSTSGGPIGPVTVSCNGAVDVAGNVQTQASSVTYNVTYNFTGFFSPVDMNGVYNVAKAGSAIPVKFKLGGDQGLNIFAAGYPKAVAVSCSSSATLDAIEETVTANASGLKYDATADQYNYTWKTGSWAGTCRRLDVMMVDGKTYSAFFKFNK